MLQSERECGKILTVKDGWLVCPGCGRNRKVIRVRPETTAQQLQVFCRMCKREYIVDMDKGECFLSHGQ